MDEYRIRVRIFVGIVLAVLCLLALRLAQLQLIDNQAYSGESQNNALREQRVQPARGVIYDRNNILIVDNEPSYTLLLTPRNFNNSRIGLLASLLEVPDSIIVNKLESAQAWSSHLPSRAFREVPLDALSRVLENLYLLPGVSYEIDERRRYQTTARAAHALGYIREITDNELEQRQERDYRPGDLIGKAGLERAYEDYLRGGVGHEFRLVNRYGLDVKSYLDGQEDIPPISGFDLYLGIDIEVQALAESLFVNKRGGAVALDPNTGEIIALVSKPDFDPETFAGTIDLETWDYLNNSPEKPLYNRATMNMMPPGSTWKPFMALMALQEGYITPTSRVQCSGYHPVGRGSVFRCMHVHGSLDVVTAIQESCNTFFFEMMRRADVNTFSRYAHMLGFGERVPTDITEQQPGLIADSTYFDNLIGAGQWGLNYTMSMGVGQGNMGVTPLQLARYIATIANGGTIYPPHLVTKLVHPETGEVILPDLPAPREIPIEPMYFDLVREGLKRVMEHGTGYNLQIPGIPSGGKTGTAQAGNLGEDDSVFILFAPFDNPRIALAVQVENAGYGGVAAGPIASLLAEKYLTGTISEDWMRQWYLQRMLNEVRSEPLTTEENEGETEADEEEFGTTQ